MRIIDIVRSLKKSSLLHLSSLLSRVYYILLHCHLDTSALPEVRGTADIGAYSPFRPILLVLTHDFIIICVYGPTAVTDMNGKTRTLRCAPFLCRLRRRECCMLGALSSQPTVPLHELPPARLVIHRQTSAHERRKWTRSVQSG